MAVINHGTVRGYKLGCRCEECTEANRKAKARERERRREREGKAPATRTPGAPVVPTKPKAGPIEEGAGAIERAARAAFVPKADESNHALAELRREVAFAAARVMDNPKAAQYFKSAADVLGSMVAELEAGQPEKAGEVSELGRILEKIGGSRGSRPARGSTSSVDDAAKPVKANGRR